MDAPELRPMNAHAAALTPVLRTVLLCDIVESTALVERLGDVRVVALLQKHDRLLREAMAFCHGQLIDKADGVLALFERPIQALDFALRYQRGLRELGASEKLELKARIGIHVGDVMTWANEPKDVLAGAKAYEVEGLAKPVAARLMNLALPGQILMSGMAQNLSQRAVGELGEAGANLRWLLHGRYSFKGVPAPMLVHEVGEPGLSPLRAPSSGAKAWREVPLWRRPPVLALELLLVGVLGTAVFWTTLRSPPAIAFAERDWVVVADLQNRTDEPIFDDALDVALRIGLEQSRHVNLVSELQIDRALERMQRQGQPVDRQLATELALREGAKAVILPTVAEVGGVVRVSLEVIDPNSGVTVYSESEDGRGSGSVLPSLDATLTRVRGSLGEAMSSVESSNLSLEQATTGNLEALKAFSLGTQARNQGRTADAEPLFQEAVRLDPGFSMAWLRLAFLRYIENDADGTRRYLDKALASKDKLSRRELLFLEGAEATLADPARAIERFKLLATLYPDDFRARYNFAYFAHFDLLRSAEARAMVGAADAPQNPARAGALYLAGALDLSLNRYDDAIASFEKADTLGPRPYRRDYVEAYLAQRKYADAERVAAQTIGSSSAVQGLEARLLDISIPLDRGRWQKARDAAETLRLAAASDGRDPLNTGFALTALALRSYAPDAELGGDLRGWSEQLVTRLGQADTLEQRHLLFQLLATGWMAAHTGDTVLARQLLARVDGHALVAAYPANESMQRVARAELALADGNPAAAVAALKAEYEGDAGSYFARAVLMRALAAAGRHEEAARFADWLASNRGRAFAEPNSRDAWQAANIVESTLALRAAARLAERTGSRDRARQRALEFSAAWPKGERLAVVKRRDATL
jgi:putative peptide modification system cyclase